MQYVYDDQRHGCQKCLRPASSVCICASSKLRLLMCSLLKAGSACQTDTIPDTTLSTNAKQPNDRLHHDQWTSHALALFQPETLPPTCRSAAAMLSQESPGQLRQLLQDQQHFIALESFMGQKPIGLPS